MGFRQVEAAGNFDPHSQEKSLEPTCCRFFSVTNLTVLFGRDKRVGKPQIL